MRKARIFLAVLAMVVLWAFSAKANTLVDLDFGRVENSAAVYVHADGLGDVHLLAGTYVLNVRTPSGSSNPFVEVSGFCVEPTWAPTSPEVYEVLPITSGALKMVAWMDQTYSGTALAAAAGVAGWEASWDWRNGNPFSLSEGNFKLYSGVDATDVTTIFYAALAAVNCGFDASGYVLFHSPPGGPTWKIPQDYVGPNPVPIPGSMFLLGSGLFGLVGLRSWRKKALAA